MCGCKKATPRSSPPPAARRALPIVPRDAPIVNSLVTLRILCEEPQRVLADVPTSARYKISDNGTLQVYAQDALVLLARECQNGPAFERLS